MSASLKRVRKTMKVDRTPRNAGTQLTIKVIRYDNGMIEVDGVPINHAPEYSQTEGWLGANEVIAITLREFARMTGGH